LREGVAVESANVDSTRLRQQYAQRWDQAQQTLEGLIGESTQAQRLARQVGSIEMFEALVNMIRTDSNVRSAWQRVNELGARMAFDGLKGSSASLEAANAILRAPLTAALQRVHELQGEGVHQGERVSGPGLADESNVPERDAWQRLLQRRPSELPAVATDAPRTPSKPTGAPLSYPAPEEPGWAEHPLPAEEEVVVEERSVLGWFKSLLGKYHR
jgi:hypothetical protein